MTVSPEAIWRGCVKFGLDRYLPAAFGSLHPKYATPHVAVIPLGIVTVGLAILGSMGGTAQQIYRTFISLEIVTYFIPYLYMFAALLVMQRKMSSVRRSRPMAPISPAVRAS